MIGILILHYTFQLNRLQSIDIYPTVTSNHTHSRGTLFRLDERSDAQPGFPGSADQLTDKVNNFTTFVTKNHFKFCRVFYRFGCQ